MYFKINLKLTVALQCTFREKPLKVIHLVNSDLPWGRVQITPRALD